MTLKELNNLRYIHREIFLPTQQISYLDNS